MLGESFRVAEWAPPVVGGQNSICLHCLGGDNRRVRLDCTSATLVPKPYKQAQSSCEGQVGSREEIYRV